MQARWLILALLFGLGLSAAPATQAVSEQADRARISRLISQLGSAKFSERRQASRELDAIGERALDALRKAMSDADLETCRQASELVARIEKRLDAAAVLAPTRVRLVCKDMPVPDAIAELAKRSRIEILIDPASQAKLAQRKVTLDTGEVPFWEALDALCQKAGLVETAWQNTRMPSHILYQNNVPALPWKPIVMPAQPAIKIQPQKLKGLPIQPQKPKQAQPQPQKPKDVQAQPQKPKDVQAQPQKPKALPAQAAKGAVLPNPVIGNVQAQIRLQQLVQARQAQIQLQLAQIQLQQAQIQIIQVQGQQAIVLSDVDWAGTRPQDYSRIVLADGKPETVPTCYAGAFRIRAQVSAGKGNRSAAITFEVTAEPRHLGWALLGKPSLEKADDDLGRSLTVLLEGGPNGVVPGQQGANVRMAAHLLYMNQHGRTAPLKRTVQIQIEVGEKSAKLKEIAGQITVEAKTGPEALLVVDNILTAGGKTIRGARGGSINIIEVAKDKNGNIHVRFKLENPPGTFGTLPSPLGRIVAFNAVNGRVVQQQIAGQGPSGTGPLALVDAKGIAFPLIGSSVTNNNGEVVQALTFQAQQGRAPAKLVYSGQRTVDINIPFSFTDLKLR